MKIKMYSKVNCPACDRDKPILQALVQGRSDVTLEMVDALTVRDDLIQMGVRTVPAFTVDGELKTLDQIKEML